MNFISKSRAYLSLLLLLAVFLPILAPVAMLTVDAVEDTAKSSGVFLIKNEKTGKYLSFFDNEYTLQKKNEKDSSQYFRLIGNKETRTYVLNSADYDAKTALSYEVSEEDGQSVLLVRSDLADAHAFTFIASGSGVNIAAKIKSADYPDEKDYYLSVRDDGTLYLSENETVWVTEEVKIKSLTMAYFETRVKLYSVQRFYAAVTPAAIASFLTWGTDDLERLMVSSDGTICALSVGEANLTVSIGDHNYTCRVEICDKDAFTWFSQENVLNSYWNAGALKGIKFYRKNFASQGGSDWMREGCAISCVAMLFHNLGAVYTKGYDFRSGQSGNIPADPYTVALANVGYKGFASASGTYYADPIYARWSVITEAFNVDGRALKVEHRFQGRAGIRDALKEHPEGVVVRLTKSNGDTHFVLFTECVNPNEKKASKLKFIIYDPMAMTKSRGDGVPFEQSESYIDGYRYSHITDFYIWTVS